MFVTRYPVTETSSTEIARARTALQSARSLRRGIELEHERDDDGGGNAATYHRHHPQDPETKERDEPAPQKREGGIDVVV